MKDAVAQDIGSVITTPLSSRTRIHVKGSPSNLGSKTLDRSNLRRPLTRREAQVRRAVEKRAASRREERARKVMAASSLQPRQPQKQRIKRNGARKDRIANR